MNVRFLKLFGHLIAVALLAACATDVGQIISEANRRSAQDGARRANTLLERHLELIDRLRAEGDPLGDYLWARAHADGWVPNAERDPIKLKQMYEHAAQRGSVDAKHVLGMIDLDGSLARSGCTQNCPMLPAEQRDWRRGLKRIEAATSEQCWHWVVVISGGGSNGQYCLSPFITARRVSAHYLFGSVLPKSEQLESDWRKRGAECKQQLDDKPVSFYFNPTHPVCRTAQ